MMVLGVPFVRALKAVGETTLGNHLLPLVYHHSRRE